VGRFVRNFQRLKTLGQLESLLILSISAREWAQGGDILEPYLRPYGLNQRNQIWRGNTSGKRRVLWGQMHPTCKYHTSSGEATKAQIIFTAPIHTHTHPCSLSMRTAAIGKVTYIGAGRVCRESITPHYKGSGTTE